MENLKLKLFENSKFKKDITINDKCILFFNKSFKKKIDIETKHFVEVYFDKDRLVIALKFYKDVKPENSIEVKESGAGAKFIYLKSFITSHRLERYLGTKHDLEVYNDKKLGILFIIKL